MKLSYVIIFFILLVNNTEKYLTKRDVFTQGVLIPCGSILNVTTINGNAGKCLYSGHDVMVLLEDLIKMVIAGKTNKGYDIYNACGVTYIDDLLIVNKSYPLPHDYMPQDGKLLKIVQSAFNRMRADMDKLGMKVFTASGYRPFEYQQKLYDRYVEKEKQAHPNKDPVAIVDTYAARPGHSEHQTGLCFDLNSVTKVFGNTNEGKWVTKNCHKYGFIVRYPYGKQHITGFTYEPWHLRYVGERLAAYLFKNKITLEEYLGITSRY